MRLHLKCLFLLGLFQAAQARTYIDGIVAEVDATATLHSHVEEKVSKGPLIKVSSYPAEENAAAFERALQDEINFSIIRRKSVELGIEIEESKVDEHIERILQQNQLTRPGLLQFLAQQGKSYDSYRQDIRDQLLLMHFRSRVIMPLVKVTKRDVENYYLQQQGTSPETVTLRLRALHFGATKGSEAYQTQEKAALEACKQLEAGKSFAEVEKALSSDNNKLQASTYSVKLPDLAPHLKEPISRLGEGQSAQPIATPNGWDVYFLEGKDYGDSGEFTAKKDQYEAELRQEETNKQLSRWLSQERANSKITILKPAQ